MLRLLRVTTASIVSFAIVVACTGWLYLIQPHSALPWALAFDRRTHSPPRRTVRDAGSRRVTPRTIGSTRERRNMPRVR